MCNVAGFIGSTKAAPRLIEMIGRQEGFNGGYYTGIVTMTDDGRLHHEKVVGDLSTLVNTTNAADLPGNVGLIHSRTKSGGGRDWSHPFVGSQNDLAYIANGSVGMFHPSDVRDTITKTLVEAGYTFSTSSEKEIGRYPRLPAGGSVHMSEVMCRLIEYHIAAGEDPVTAMGRSFVDAPSEIVGLMIHSSMPGRIVASRINQPLMIGRHSDGWVMATTALAFETENTVAGDLINETGLGAGNESKWGDGLDGIQVEWTIPMAPSSTAVFSADGFDVRPFRFVSEVSYPFPLEKTRTVIMEQLSEGEPRTMTQIANGLREALPKERVMPVYMTVYETIRSLLYDGLIQFDTIHVPGVEKGLTAPQTRIVFRV